jgi:hypothetical protein
LTTADQKAQIRDSYHLMDSITVTVHDGAAPAQRTTVCVMDPLQILHDRIPAGGRRLIVFRGSVVMAGFSFRHHGIKDGDDLYVVRPRTERKSPPTMRPGIYLSGARSFGLVSSGLLREAARLSDLTDHGRLIRAAMLDIADDPLLHSQMPRTVIPRSGEAGKLSTEPLPTSWG